MKEEGPSERPLTTLRIAGVPEHFNLPWQLGLERRAFVRAGIDVQWRTVPEGTGAMCQLLREGEIDIAMLVTEGAVRDILNGNPSRIISHYADSPLTWGVHVGAGSGIGNAAELKGIPFATSRINSGSHLAAVNYARHHGWALDAKDLIVVNDLQGAVVHLQQEAPAAFLWEKYTTKPLVDTGTFHRVDEFRTSWPAFMIVATEAVLAHHPADVQRLLKVIRDQAAGLMARKTAPEMIAHRYGMQLADAKAWFSEVRWNTSGTVDGMALLDVARTLRASGALASGPEDAELLAALIQAPI